MLSSVFRIMGYSTVQILVCVFISLCVQFLAMSLYGTVIYWSIVVLCSIVQTWSLTGLAIWVPGHCYFVVSGRSRHSTGFWVGLISLLATLNWWCRACLPNKRASGYVSFCRPATPCGGFLTKRVCRLGEHFLCLFSVRGCCANWIDLVRKVSASVIVNWVGRLVCEVFIKERYILISILF